MTTYRSDQLADIINDLLSGVSKPHTANVELERLGPEQMHASDVPGAPASDPTSS